MLLHWHTNWSAELWQGARTTYIVDFSNKNDAILNGRFHFLIHWSLKASPGSTSTKSLVAVTLVQQNFTTYLRGRCPALDTSPVEFGTGTLEVASCRFYGWTLVGRVCWEASCGGPIGFRPRKVWGLLLFVLFWQLVHLTEWRIIIPPLSWFANSQNIFFLATRSTDSILQHI